MTLLPIVIPVKEVQPENTESPILVTLSGIVMLFKEVQLQNADSLIIAVFFPSYESRIIISVLL